MQESNPDLHYLKLWLATGYSLAGLVIYLSLTGSPVDLELGIPFQDKFFHALAYFTLMGWFTQIYHVKKQRVSFALLFIIMGVVLEHIQSLDPARYYEVEDMIANMVGIAIAVLLARKTSFRYLLVKFERIVT